MSGKRLYLDEQRAVRERGRQYVGLYLEDPVWAQTIQSSTGRWGLYVRIAASPTASSPYKPKRIGELNTRNKAAVRAVLDALLPFVDKDQL